MKSYFLKIFVIILLIFSSQTNGSSPIIAGTNPLFAIPLFTIAGGEATFFGGSFLGLFAIVAKQVVSHFVAKKVVPGFLFDGNQERGDKKTDLELEPSFHNQKNPKNKQKASATAAATATQNNRKKSSQKEIAPAQKTDPIEPINELANLDDILAKPLGRGSTGRTEAHNLHEQLAMKEVMSNPLEPSPFFVPIKMTDNRWLQSDGWAKFQRTYPTKGDTEVVIHFNYNEIKNCFDDFKFKFPE